jgi:UDP-N-acetylmuramoylalanine--D-glutamate ligase
MLENLLKNKGFVSGGNIGTPLASFFNTTNTKRKLLILETSSFTLHYTNKAKPNIYILLPINKDHILWHTTFKEYEKSKLKPLDNLKEGEIAIVPKKYKDYPTNGYKICYEKPEDFRDIFDIDIKKVKFKEPFLLDALLALATQKILFDKIDYKKINNFIQDEHKLEKLKDNLGRVWINDSKATNIDATIQAIKRYKKKKMYLILGGDDKGVNLKPLFKELKKYNVQIFIIGANTKRFEKLSTRYNISFTISKTLKKAVQQISKQFINKTNIAILSPATASFDQFNSYKQRGKKFKRLVSLF